MYGGGFHVLIERLDSSPLPNSSHAESLLPDFLQLAWYVIQLLLHSRPTGGDNQKNVILAPLIDGRTVSREPNIHSGSFNNAEQFSINVSFNMFYSKAKIDKINSLLTCLCCMHFCGMTFGFLS